MKKYTLYLLNITHDESTNGVDRYVSCLLSGLEKTIRPDRLYHIRLISGGQTILHRAEELPHYTRITIPLPERPEPSSAKPTGQTSTTRLPAS